MYRRMLIPVRVPSEVEPMIRFAANLLDADGEIRVLHVIPSASLPEVTRQWRSSVHLVVPAHEAGAALDVRVEPEVRVARDVATEILETAEEHEVESILLTLRGDRRSRNPFVGHTASSLLHHAHSDVLIVNRLAMAADHIPRVLVPLFSEHPVPKAMQVAEEIAIHNHGAPIVQIFLGARADAGGGARSGVSARGVEMRLRRSSISEALLGRPARLPELLLQEAARERYGFMLIADSASAPSPFLTRRFLEELFRRAPCPVLAFRG